MGRQDYPYIAAEEACYRALWSLALEDGDLRERLVAAATYLIISWQEWPPEMGEMLQELRTNLTRANVPVGKLPATVQAMTDAEVRRWAGRILELSITLFVVASDARSQAGLVALPGALEEFLHDLKHGQRDQA
jgi:hypothetical protein